MSLSSRTRNALRTAGAVLAVAGTLAAGGVTAAAPAVAAGGSANDIAGCFTYANGTTYAAKGAYLLRYTDRGWTYTGRSTTTAPGGCARFNDIASNQYFAIQAFWEYSPNGGATQLYYNGFSSYGFSGAATDTLVSAGRGTVQGPYCLRGC